MTRRQIGLGVMREREYYHLGNLCNLHEIPAPYHSILASVLPVEWRGASAAPVRGDRRGSRPVKAGFVDRRRPYSVALPRLPPLSCIQIVLTLTNSRMP
jgi:hypothetical protein